VGVPRYPQHYLRVAAIMSAMACSGWAMRLGVLTDLLYWASVPARGAWKKMIVGAAGLFFSSCRSHLS
jgi:hypothetical protein